MKVVIIEDEVETAWDIQASIEKVRPDYKVLAVLDHVESSIDWFRRHAMPDLIISDIRLGDGLSFDIFRTIQLKCPVIFCTAYDEYALDAFRTNGVDYLLKPVNEEMLNASLTKIEGFVNYSNAYAPDRGLMEALSKSIVARASGYRRNLLVRYRNQLIPILTEQVAIFGIKGKDVFLHTLEGKRYQVAETLEELERILDPFQFYRANRQFIISIKAIRQIEHIDGRKLSIETHLQDVEPLTVSKARASQFLNWIQNR
jgi:DNA-binding LytR/AlgR family response regulator